MTEDEIITQLQDLKCHCQEMYEAAIKNGDTSSSIWGKSMWGKDVEALDMAIKALEKEPCEMTAEEYRQRMIQAFHNADTDELIAICVLPTEKEFEHLEWLLKNHYKKEPCEDAISREAVEDIVMWYYGQGEMLDEIQKLPSVQTKPKTGHWEYVQYDNNLNIGNWHCSECRGICTEMHSIEDAYDYCPNCGAKMVESKESEEEE